MARTSQADSARRVEWVSGVAAICWVDLSNVLDDQLPHPAFATLEKPREPKGLCWTCTQLGVRALLIRGCQQLTRPGLVNLPHVEER